MTHPSPTARRFSDADVSGIANLIHSFLRGRMLIFPRYLDEMPDAEQARFYEAAHTAVAIASGAATPAPTAALTEEELLTPELIKKAADAGERVGWDDVLTPNAQIYHRAIDLKKYETALRAVLPIIIDRLAKSPPQGAEE